MAETINIAREYRDRLFKFIFGNPDNKEWTLSLYNAMNNSHYTDPNDITINTLDDVVYMGMKNDVSFLIDSTMNLYEQQSTFNPNMPARFLIYAGMLYAKYIEQTPSYHIYSSKQQSLPTPKCVCFYNGDEVKDDKSILELGDAFPDKLNADIDLRVTMININYGHNKELLDACISLNEYSLFVSKIREYQHSSMTLIDAVNKALDELPNNSVIKPFLLANKAEVTGMCITEYNEAKTFADQRDEGWAEGVAKGRAEGEKKGTITTLTNLVKDGLISLSVGATRANMSIEEFEKCM